MVILGVVKVVFWTFSKFFLDLFLGSVWTLLSTLLLGLLFVVFSAPKVDKGPQKLKLSGKNYAHSSCFDGSFLTILGPTKSICGIFKVVLELFDKCIGVVFDLKRPTFGSII